ncbi:chemotaxis protein CheB [Actinoplanes sp. CA-252034]|uniref:chemotaxis protein CheB n=1 Tax=Actinoplanes sp. CA-252034 TaxID=3239906 RepID=UPI003D97D10E
MRRDPIIALVASAGGVSALTAVLRDLPDGLPVPVTVQQHLSAQGSTLVKILRERSRRDVAWAESGAGLPEGRVLVCPPRHRLEVLPDGTLELIDNEPGARSYPHDGFLRSLADAYGARAVAVVLTGMGRDGAAGAAAVREAGGLVIVQDQDSSEFTSMPRAATASAHLVLPLGHIGGVLADLARGRPLPRPRTEIEAAASLFRGPGEVERLLRAKDWSATPLGPVTRWPEVLRAVVRITLDSGFPAAVWWGPELIQIYNESWRQFLGSTKHPQALAGRADQTWPELWSVVGPMIANAQSSGVASGAENMPMLMDRNGSLEEVYVTFTYSPITGDQGSVLGVQNSILDTTATMVAERRMTLLRTVAAETAGARQPEHACEMAAAALARSPADVPFALLYVIDHARREARLAGAAGLEPGSFAAPRILDLVHGAPVWPLPSLLGRPSVHRGGLLVTGLDERLGGLLAPPVSPAGALPPDAALLLPMVAGPDDTVTGVLVAGLNRHQPFDDAYRGFLDLLTGQIGAALALAHTRHRERQSLDKLAELDRLKTEFFSNVSHEFRTPLTLMLGPLEQMLHRSGDATDPDHAEIALMYRNAQRLLRLVGTLLDFSQAEAGRLRAAFVPTDLAALTTDIASMFTSAAEAAGLKLTIDTPPLPGPVWVDAEMWEKIVSNLLSNALKFTWQGAIEVILRPVERHAELIVRDSGVGIPSGDLPYVFKRFHRVRDARGRTHEGAGIGLALVDELVRRHHGRIRVTSRPEAGTAFTVWIPMARRPATAAGEPAPARVGGLAESMAREAAHWNVAPGHDDETDGLDDPAALRDLPVRPASDVRVLVADDNPDMRDYLARLLGASWSVAVAADGEQALDVARRERPDLILADVMMPRMDGFALLREIRADVSLAATPVVLLTARVGEETAIEGLLAGADDYVVKPFTARELVARIDAQLQMARLRRVSERRFRTLRDASFDAVYRMSADWSSLDTLDGHGFLADTTEPIASWLETYIDPADQPEVLAAIDAAIAAKGVFQLEHRVRRPDGTLGRTLSRAVPLLDDDGEIIEWIGTATDLTTVRSVADADKS